MKTKNTPVGKYIFFGLIFLFTAVVTFISTGYKADNIKVYGYDGGNSSCCYGINAGRNVV